MYPQNYIVLVWCYCVCVEAFTRNRKGVHLSHDRIYTHYTGMWATNFVDMFNTQHYVLYARVLRTYTTSVVHSDAYVQRSR